MTDHDAPDIRAWAALAQAHKSVLGSIEAALKDSGLPPLAWYDVLLELDRVGPDGVRPYALEEHLRLPQYALSRLLSRIAEAGLIERRPCSDDRRGFVVVLTEEGARTHRRMWPIYRAALLSAIGLKLDKADTEELTKLLDALA